MSVSESTLGSRVRQARLERGWCQRELAEKAGVTTRAVQFWEYGQREPGYLSLLHLGAALACPLEWLLTGATPSPQGEHTDDCNHEDEAGRGR
jgi:transcriptional regulator with XRE-family HTH domain